MNNYVNNIWLNNTVGNVRSINIDHYTIFGPCIIQIEKSKFKNYKRIKKWELGRPIYVDCSCGLFTFRKNSNGSIGRLNKINTDDVWIGIRL